MLADRLCLQRREQVGQQVPLPVSDWVQAAELHLTGDAGVRR